MSEEINVGDTVRPVFGEWKDQDCIVSKILPNKGVTYLSVDVQKVGTLDHKEFWIFDVVKISQNIVKEEEK